MANEVTLKLAIEGGKVVSTEIGGVITDVGKLGQAAKDSSEQMVSGFGRARQGIISISQQLESAQESLIGVAKAAASVWATEKLFGYVKEMAMLNARHEELGVVMAVVGKNAGYNAQQMDYYAKQTQHMGITMLESRNTVIALAQANIDLADASKLARIAQDAAVVGNTNSSVALQSMIHGIKTAQTDVLRTVGINVSFEDSYKKLADQLHVSATALSEHQKMQARENAVIDEGAKLVGAYEAAMTTAGKQMRSMARYTEDLKVIRGEVFNEALTIGVMAFVDQLKDANTGATELANNGALKDWAQDVASSMVWLADSVMGVRGTFKLVGDAIGGVAARMAVNNQFSMRDLQDPKNMELWRAQMKAIDDAQEQSTAKVVSSMSMFRDALAKRRAAHAEESQKIADNEKTYLAAQLVVQQAYANHSLEIQRAAQLALRNAYFAPDPVKPKDASTASVVAKVSEYQKLNEAMDQQMALAEEELKYGGKLAASDKYRVQTIGKITDAYTDSKISAAQWAQASAKALDVAERMKVVEESETALKVAKERQALREKEAAGIQAYFEKQTEAYNADVRGANDALAAAQREYEQFGLTKSQIEALTVTRLEDRLVAHAAGSEAYEALMREIAARKEAINWMKKSEVRDAGIEAAKASTNEWKRGWEETDRIAREAFTGWADHGASMADSIGKALKKSLQSAIYDATIKPIAFSIYSSIAGAPASAAGPATAGAFGAFTGTSLAAVGSQIGSAASISMSNGLVSGFGANMANIAGQVEAGSYAAAFGMAVPYIAAAVAIYAILSQDHGTPTQNTGNASATFDASGARTGYSTAFGGSSAATDAMLATLQANYMASARALGLGTVATSFSYGGNTGKDSQNPQFALGGAAGGRSFYQGETGLNDAAVSLAASRAVFAALQGSELPGYLAKVFDGLSAGAMTQQDISNTLAFATSLKDVRYSMLSADQQLQILQSNVASGFASLGTSSATFKSDFVAAIDAGISPDRLAAWQALGVDMQNLASAAGSADVTVAAVSRSLADIANERTRLSDQLDALTMSSAELLAKQRNAVDASNQALFDQVQAASQAKDATAALAQTQQDTAAAATQLASTNRTWQDQLDVLTGAATERSIALRDATGDSTRALMQQVYAQQDLKTATDAAAASEQQATQQIASRAAAVEAERTRLQDQLDSATMSSAELLAKQRGALDASNQGLFDQVQTATLAARSQAALEQAQAQAGQQAIQAAQQIKSAWQSITDSIYGEVARIRGLMSGTGAAGYAQAQAQFAVATIQARAGDQSAAKLLPGLSQSVTALAAENAASSADLQFELGRIAASLNATAGAASGQYGLVVPAGVSTAPALVYQGEALVAQAFRSPQSSSGSGGNADVVAELRDLKSKLDAVQTQLDAALIQLRRTADATNGQPENTPQVEVVT